MSADTVTRFAPSPTGYIHVGNLRTALMNYLIARKSGGTFILRIDDTDQNRSKEEYVDGIKQDLTWLGLEWDRVERQSERLDRYHAAAEDLREKGRFYEAFETPTELDLKRKKQLNMGKPPVYDRAALSLTDAQKDALRAERGSGVWRFKLDQSRIEWADGILGDISIDAASVSDPVLIRGDGQILYTLASVVDDTEMGVTHVVRGSDHVTNTGTQIQIILRDLREQGVEPFALLSLMARLGSSDPVELRTDMAALIEGFDIERFGSAPTKFDVQDLFPLTGRYLQTRTAEDVAETIAGLGVPQAQAAQFWAVTRENIETLHDLKPWWEMFRDGADPVIEDGDEAFVAEAMALLPEMPFDESTWSTWTAAVKEATGRKGRGLFRPLRLALTGQEHGPEMAAVMPLLRVVKARG